eukprot:TRINITY_DN1849_c0_g2_i2.p2 TRINITY_DN1849_c0_g2~~TRINITY_DN1849_c0_g2_i2.p2  ORF type:complete len:217 (-),score=68.84 TRINITY_DN1849_c0_g2_i2:28-678(-)
MRIFSYIFHFSCVALHCAMLETGGIFRHHGRRLLCRLPSPASLSSASAASAASSAVAPLLPSALMALKLTALRVFAERLGLRVGPGEAAGRRLLRAVEAAVGRAVRRAQKLERTAKRAAQREAAALASVHSIGDEGGAGGERRVGAVGGSLANVHCGAAMAKRRPIAELPAPAGCVQSGGVGKEAKVKEGSDGGAGGNQEDNEEEVVVEEEEEEDE